MNEGLEDVYCWYEKEKISLGVRIKFAAVSSYDAHPNNQDYPCYFDEDSCDYKGPYFDQPYFTCYSGPLNENGCTESTTNVVFFNKDIEFTDRTLRKIPANFTREMAITLGDGVVKTSRRMSVTYDFDDIGIGFHTSLEPRTLTNAFNFCEYIIDQIQRERNSKSSSSTTISSSSAPSFSSSSKDKVSSSSSSSSIAESSSATEKSSSSINPVQQAEEFDGTVNSPDQIFDSGLQNMEEGSCYSLNPARVGEFDSWVNNNAQDSWWWREVECSTGNRIDKNKIGACPGFPLDSVPKNPISACFAYNGSCYKCNSNRGSDCGLFWLWTETFTYNNIGWWYVEIDCYTSLQKRIAEKTHQEDLFNNKFEINFLSPQKYFDVMGRNKTRRSSKKQIIYTK